MVYTDRSVIDSRIGLACGQAVLSCAPRRMATMFHCTAIYGALHSIRSCTGESFICGDSQSSLKSLEQCYPLHPMIMAIQESIYNFQQWGQASQEEANCKLILEFGILATDL